MRRKLDREILKRFVAGESTEEERYIVWQWIKESENDPDVDEFLSYHWDNLNYKSDDKVDYDRVFNLLDKRLKRGALRSMVVTNKLLIKIAATFIGLMLVVSIAYLMTNTTQLYSTQYGEISKFYLPDSSEVLLNGNSKLSFNSNWSRDDVREVTLEGEAFFSVKHTLNDQKFVVHTSESVFIEVLGTKFNVSNRQNGTEVTLQEGSIRLNILSDKQNMDTHESLIMMPGELVSLKKNSGKYEKKLVNTDLYTSWSQNKLVLDYTPLHEIVNYLRETNGWNVIVSDPELLKIKASGTMPTADPELLVTIIAETFNLKVTRTGGKIYFSLD